MAVVCPSCDVIPPADGAPGTKCLGCGARLVVVTAQEPAIGTVVDGRFEIRERLGAGGMAVVYRATQLSIGRDVALKILPSMQNEAVVKRFFREAQVASALNHPNSVQIIEFGQGADGHCYLAMELVRGHTLTAELGKGPLPMSRIVRIGTQLCDAIEAAHRLTIVHRDLKLDNVMLLDGAGDHVKILDFGIARVLGDPNSRVTAVGLAAGTPHYMAPEVISSAAEPAPEQDMYALGVMLAELALGELLWTNATSLPMLLIEKTRNTVVERVPSRLRPLVRRLMSEAPDARPSPAETRRGLQELERRATDPAAVAQTVPPPFGDALAKTADLMPVGPLDVVSLDERDNTRRDQPPASAFEPPKAETPALDVVEPGASLEVEPGAKRPPIDSGPALKLEGSWESDRAGRKVKPSHEAQRFAKENAQRPSSGGGRWLLVLLIVAAVGGAGVYYHVTTRRHPSSDAAKKSPGATTPTHRAPTHEPAPPRDMPAPRPPDEPAPPPPDPAGDARGVTIRIVGPSGTAITIDGSPVGKVPIKLSRKKGTKPILIEGPGIVRQVVPDHSQTVDLSKPEE
jgi:serine/threonine protein kinase